MDDLSKDSKLWWAAHRRRYNIIVAGIGGSCFLLSLPLASILPGVEVTPFTIVFQAVAAGTYLILANVGYSIAPLVQRYLRPTRPERFQSMAFRLGIAVTVFPFVAVPIVLISRMVCGW